MNETTTAKKFRLTVKLNKSQDEKIKEIARVFYTSVHRVAETTLKEVLHNHHVAALQSLPVSITSNSKGVPLTSDKSRRRMKNASLNLCLIVDRADFEKIESLAKEINFTKSALVNTLLDFGLKNRAIELVFEKRNKKEILHDSATS